MPKVLLVMPEAARAEARRALVDAGCDVVEAPGAGCDLALVDVEAHPDPIAAVRALGAGTPIVAVDGPRPVAAHVAILRAGVLDVLVRPLRATEIARVLDADGHPALLGDSEAVRLMIEQLEPHARSSSPVVLTGEADTGFASIARLLHLSSDRARHPFVVFRSRDDVTPEDAFAEAIAEARDGTLYLDGVDALSPALVQRLARLHRDPKANVRFVASSTARVVHPELAARIAVPPLRERPEDVPLLAQHIASVLARRTRSGATLPAPTLRTLQAHRWSGNLAELSAMVGALLRAPSPEAHKSGEFRVPVRRDPVRLTLADGARHEGTVFRAGDEPFEAVLDKPEPFLPIDAGGAVRLYARRAIACVTVKREVDRRPPAFEARIAVTVRLRCGARIDGGFRYDAPRGRARAIDHLNGETPLFAVHDGAEVHYVAKEHVEHVEESR